MKIAPTPASNTQSLLTSLMGDYALANRWAMDSLVSWLKTKPADIIEKDLASSFPGIRGTLVHIWDTERFWLSFIRKQPAPESYLMSGFPGTLEQVFEGAQKTSAELAEYVTSLDEQELAEILVLDKPWAQGSKTRYEFIQHCINHSSYHRGQAITLGHQVGFKDAPSTDFSFYLLVVKQ